MPMIKGKYYSYFDLDNIYYWIKEVDYQPGMDIKKNVKEECSNEGSVDHE